MKIPFIPTVDSVVADFTKMVEKLEILANHHGVASLHYEEQAAQCVTKANEQLRQKQRAEKLAANINNLLV